MPTRRAPSTLSARSSTNSASPGRHPEALERQIVDRRVGLDQFLLARDDDAAEAIEHSRLARAERRPEFAGEIGDREQRHAAPHRDRRRARASPASARDAVAEARAPGGDQLGMLRDAAAISSAEVSANGRPASCWKCQSLVTTSRRNASSARSSGIRRS